MGYGWGTGGVRVGYGWGTGGFEIPYPGVRPKSYAARYSDCALWTVDCLGCCGAAGRLIHVTARLHPARAAWRISTRPALSHCSLRSPNPQLGPQNSQIESACTPFFLHFLLIFGGFLADFLLPCNSAVGSEGDLRAPLRAHGEPV